LISKDKKKGGSSSI
jgi:hypothetical protein